MKDTYDILIVGAGAAGLTAAAYCSRAGRSVLLCERAEKTGGLVGSFKREGYLFDAGIRAFEDSGVITPMLRSLGIALDFVQNPVRVGIGDQIVQLDKEHGLDRYMDLLKRNFPDQTNEIDAIRSEIERVMEYMSVLYGIENPLFLENELKNPHYLLHTFLPWLIKYTVNIKKANRLNEPIRLYLARFTKCKPLIDMICQHFFEETPAFFALSYFGLYLDYRYPVGGTGTLPEKLTEFVCSNGGEVLTNAEVVRIDIYKNEATLQDGRTIHYLQLIWAADQTALYHALIGPLPKTVEQKKDIVLHSRGIDSVLSLYLGTDLSPAIIENACGAHSFYTPDKDGLSTLPDWHSLRCEGPDAVRRWVISFFEKTTYEISVPVLRDASLASEGKSGFIISTLFDYELASYFRDNEIYEELKSLAQVTILRVLGQKLLPRLSEHVSFASCSTPLSIERMTGAKHGAITGWAYTNKIMPAEYRFSKVSRSVLTEIPNLLQCGMWTFSPAGLPVSIMTGKLAADEAIRRTKP